MTRHAPLTDQQKDLLFELEKGPIELTITERSRDLKWKGLEFLTRCGYVDVEKLFEAQDRGDNLYRHTRSGKPLQQD